MRKPNRRPEHPDRSEWEAIARTGRLGPAEREIGYRLHVWRDPVERIAADLGLSRKRVQNVQAQIRALLDRWYGLKGQTHVEYPDRADVADTAAVVLDGVRNRSWAHESETAYRSPDWWTPVAHGEALCPQDAAEVCRRAAERRENPEPTVREAYHGPTGATDPEAVWRAAEAKEQARDDDSIAPGWRELD